MKPNRNPPIAILRQDLVQLEPLAAIPHRSQNRDYLAAELERAEIIDALTQTPIRVHLNARVSFKDLISGEIQSVTLVMPSEADISDRRISILTPVGTALLGLSAGQTISYTLPNGKERELQVLSINDGMI